MLNEIFGTLLRLLVLRKFSRRVSRLYNKFSKTNYAKLRC